MITRRVWQDVGRGVMICTEETYQTAIRDGYEVFAVGFPKEDVELADTAPAAATTGED